MDADIIRVLLIEDSSADSRLIQEMLKNIITINFDIHFAPRLSTGVKLLKERPFDAILLDLSLPDSLGLEGFYKLQSIFPAIPVIILTGLAAEEVAIEAVRSGAQDYLIKGKVDSNLLGQSIRYGIERKKAENALLKLEKRRAKFITMTSHELRTPLTVILGYLDYLKRRGSTLSSDELLKFIQPIHRSARRLWNLIEGVKDLTEIDKNFFRINLSKLEINQFLEESLSQHKNTLLNQLEFTKYTGPETTMFYGDSSRLQQIIDNLIENAVKNSSVENRKIRIFTEILPDSIRIHTKDNGAGIEEENFDIIFEQFISIPTEYHIGGSGIGLYISRKIAEAHGGSLTVCSEGEGKGAEFILELPRIR